MSVGRDVLQNEGRRRGTKKMKKIVCDSCGVEFKNGDVMEKSDSHNGYSYFSMGGGVHAGQQTRFNGLGPAGERTPSDTEPHEHSMGVTVTSIYDLCRRCLVDVIQGVEKNPEGASIQTYQTAHSTSVLEAASKEQAAIARAMKVATQVAAEPEPGSAKPVIPADGRAA